MKMSKKLSGSEVDRLTIKLDQVCFQFGDSQDTTNDATGTIQHSVPIRKNILDSISLEIPQGKLIAVVGNNTAISVAL